MVHKNFKQLGLIGIAAIAFALFFSSCQKEEISTKKNAVQTEDATSRLKSANLSKTIGYLPLYQWDLVNAKNAKKYLPMLTDINLAFANVAIAYNSKSKQWEVQYDGKGYVQLAITDDGKKINKSSTELKTMINNLKQNNSGLSIFISIGGAVGSSSLLGSYKYLFSTAAQRKTLINGINKLVQDYGLNGCDIDFEYKALVLPGYNEFIQELVTKLHSNHKLITLAVEYKYPKGLYIDGHLKVLGSCITDASLKSIDWINLMSYDYSKNNDLSSSPINTKNHSPIEITKRDFQYWKTARNVASNKIVIGLPFYGKQQYSTGSEVAIRNLILNKDEYVHNGSTNYYNGSATLISKTQYARSNSAKGVMIWSIGSDNYDDNSSSALKVIYDNK